MWPVDIDGHESLLAVLRDRLGLTGSKNACEAGECGSCSVLVDGRLVCSCLILAAAAEGSDVRTIESRAGGDLLSRIQDSFAQAGAVQCGFCTPGFVVATYALLRENPAPSGEEIREALAGNLCRCTGYGRIVDAVERLSATVPRAT